MTSKLGRRLFQSHEKPRVGGGRVHTERMEHNVPETAMGDLGRMGIRRQRRVELVPRHPIIICGVSVFDRIT